MTEENEQYNNVQRHSFGQNFVGIFDELLALILLGTDIIQNLVCLV